MDQCQKSKEDNGWKCDKRKIFKMWLFAKEMVQIFALVEAKDTLNDLSKASFWFAMQAEVIKSKPKLLV